MLIKSSDLKCLVKTKQDSVYLSRVLYLITVSPVKSVNKTALSEAYKVYDVEKLVESTKTASLSKKAQGSDINKMRFKVIKYLEGKLNEKLS